MFVTLTITLQASKIFLLLRLVSKSCS